MRPSEELQRFWASTGFDVPTRVASEQEIRALETRYGVTLPEGFRDYLLLSSPTDESAYDASFCLWWPLHRIRNLPEEYPHPVHNSAVTRDASRYLFFADHSIWAWAWVIACGEDENRGRIAIVGTQTDQFVAEDFAEFVSLYARDLNAVSPMP
jgi:hypothetical protein